MENSTKALLIAASVLIVIVLISIGIKLLGSASNVTDQVDNVSQSMASSVFNSQFTSYFGNSTSGSQAKALISKIMFNNNNCGNTFSKEKHHIYVNYKNSSGSYFTLSGASTAGHKFKPNDLQLVYNHISNNKNYIIQSTNGCGSTGSNSGYYNGYILCITIKEK